MADYKTDIPAKASHLIIMLDASMPALSPGYRYFDLVVSGKLAEEFAETYKLELEAMAGTTELNPHPRGFNFKSGQFDDYEFPITLFCGCYFNGYTLEDGAAIKSVAEGLSNLAKPRWLSSRFSSSPLCAVGLKGPVVGYWWSAWGYFVSSTVTFRGGCGDQYGLPTVVDVNLGFRRHFGEYGESGLADIKFLSERVTCTSYVFSRG
jgi:hypothetical protein